MKKKIISICLVISLLTVAVVGTVAYFTDTDEATNVFTAGKKVDIDLEEDVTVPEEHEDDPDWKSGDPTADGADYDDIVPGVNYAKKPVISVEANSKDVFAFAEISMTNMNVISEATGIAVEDIDDLLVNANLGTNVIDSWLDTDGTFHVVYSNGIMTAGSTWTLFEAFKIPETTTYEDLEAAMTKYGVDDPTFNLDIKAYAIQTEGFADAQSAWVDGFGKTLHN